MKTRILLLAVLLGWVAGVSCELGATAGSIPAQLTKGPADAPITILVFTEIGCTSCSRLDKTLSELLHNRPDEIHLIFKHHPQAMRPEVLMAHEAAVAAAEQGKFWEMHDLLNENASKLRQEDLERYAQKIGLKIARFKEAMKDHRYRPWIEKDIAEARALGVVNVPTLFINGRRMSGARNLDELTAAIQSALGLPVAGPPTPEPQGFVDLNLSRSPTRGDQNAPVTIIEFSDYQCPYCRRAVDTVKQLLSAYPGKIRWVFKNYPLVQLHPDAMLAHRAALAAGEQGKYWEMHDLIFENQNRIKREDLIRYAEQLKLEPKRFQSSLDSPAHQTVIASDQSEGERLGVDGTPTFFVNGRRLVGAVPYTDFQRLVEEELRRAEAKPQ